MTMPKHQPIPTLVLLSNHSCPAIDDWFESNLIFEYATNDNAYFRHDQRLLLLVKAVNYFTNNKCNLATVVLHYKQDGLMTAGLSGQFDSIYKLENSYDLRYLKRISNAIDSRKMTANIWSAYAKSLLTSAKTLKYIGAATAKQSQKDADMHLNPLDALVKQMDQDLYNRFRELFSAVKW